MPRPNRWEDVVNAASAVFKEKGYGAASIEDVANAVGMLKGSLYHYIESKEDLLLAVVRPTAERLLAEVRSLAVMDLPASEKVRRFTRAHVRVLDSNFDDVSVYVHEIAGRHTSPEFAAMDHEYTCAVQDMLEQGVRDGSFRSDLHIRTTTRALIGALNWLTRWYRPGDLLVADRIADQIAEIFLSGVLTRKTT